MVCLKLVSRVIIAINFIEVHLHTNKTHSFYVYSSGSFDNCIHSCKHYHFQDIFLITPQLPSYPFAANSSYF